MKINSSFKNSMVWHDANTDTFYFSCPHCDLICQVPRCEIRCTIFRHAVFKDSMRFVPPHASKETCEQWLREDRVWGCAKPFQFDGHQVIACGYI